MFWIVGVDDVLIGFGVSALMTWLAASSSGCTESDADEATQADDAASDAVPTVDRYDPQPPRGDTAGPGDLSLPVPDAPCPPPCLPLGGTVTPVGKVPCGEASFIADVDAGGYAVCVNWGTTSHLFRTDAATGQTLSVWETDAALDQLAIGSGAFFLTGQDSTTFDWGIFEATPEGDDAKWHPFPEATVDGTTFQITFPKGILEHAGHLYVAAASPHFGGPQDVPTYDPGIVLIYPLRADGLIAGAATILPTSDVNPTSMGLLGLPDGARIGVVDTGGLGANGRTSGTSLLDLIDPATDALADATSLALSGLGIAGEITASKTHAAFPSADNSSQIVVLSLANIHTSMTFLTMPGHDEGALHFISFSKFSPDGRYLLAGDFNRGNIATWDMAFQPPMPVGEPIPVDADPGDAAGIGDGEWVEGALLLSVGPELKWVK